MSLISCLNWEGEKSHSHTTGRKHIQHNYPGPFGKVILTQTDRHSTRSSTELGNRRLNSGSRLKICPVTL